MLTDNDFFNSSGVILAREIYGENTSLVTLFLREVGIIRATTRYTGGYIEPFQWGVFYLKRKVRSRKFFIEEIDIKDIMFAIRKTKERILTSFKWINALLKYLESEQPDDELLTNLYWSMKLLTSINYDIADWRFFWRWLELWGLAPDIVNFHRAMNFNDDEIILLAKVAALNTKGIIQLFSQPINLTIRENMFKVASKLAMNFLNEK